MYMPPTTGCKTSQVQPISCELALHWFHNPDSIDEYIMVPLLPCRSSTEVKFTEASLIQKWGPPLNFPFTIRLMPTNPISSTSPRCMLHSLATKYGTPGTAPGFAGNFDDECFTPCDCTCITSTVSEMTINGQFSSSSLRTQHGHSAPPDHAEARSILWISYSRYFGWPIS